MNVINSQRVKLSTPYCLIPQTPNREPVLLTVAVPVGIPIAVVQVAAPSNDRIVLRRTPPVTVVANGVEIIPITVADPARKTSK